MGGFIISRIADIRCQTVLLQLSSDLGMSSHLSGIVNASSSSLLNVNI